MPQFVLLFGPLDWSPHPPALVQAAVPQLRIAMLAVKVDPAATVDGTPDWLMYWAFVGPGVTMTLMFGIQGPKAILF